MLRRRPRQKAKGEKTTRAGETDSEEVTVEMRRPPSPHLQDMYSSLVSYKELVKALAGIWGPSGDMIPSTASLLSALRAELALTHVHARQHIKEERRRGDEIDRMRRQLAEEVREWMRRRDEADRSPCSSLLLSRHRRRASPPPPFSCSAWRPSAFLGKELTS